MADPNEWIAGAYCREVWETQAFAELSRLFGARKRPRRYTKGASRWLELRRPDRAERLYLITAELPIHGGQYLHLRVWVDRHHLREYDALSTATRPVVFGQCAVRELRSELPPSNWTSAIREGARGICITVDGRPIFDDRRLVAQRLDETLEAFCRYVLAVIEDVRDVSPALSTPLPVPPAVEAAQSPREYDAFDPAAGGAAQTLPEDDALDIVTGTSEAQREIDGDPRFAHVPERTRLALVNARIGQGGYRERMLNLWGRCCAVTGCELESVLVASHAKPFKDSNLLECLDEYNGLPLVASLDRLFEHGMIAFADDGSLLLSELLSPEARGQLGLTGRASLRSLLQPGHRPYLRWHREHKFFARQA